MSMKFMVLVNQCKFDNPLKKLVFLQLADNADEKGECFPSYQYIADISGCGRSTVRKHIQALKAQGFIKVKNRIRQGAYTSNVYHIVQKKLKEHSLKFGKKGVSPDSTPLKENEGGVSPDDIPKTPKSSKNGQNSQNMSKNCPKPGKGVSPGSTGVSPDDIGGVSPDSTITSHSIEPVNEPRKVFDYWKKKFKIKNAVMDDGREAAITWAIDNYSFDMCIKAIDGCAASNWHVENGHTGIDLIFKDAEKIERFIGKAPTKINQPVKFPKLEFVLDQINQRLSKKIDGFECATTEYIWCLSCNDFNHGLIVKSKESFLQAAEVHYQSELRKHEGTS